MSPGLSTRLLATQSDERLISLARDGHERAFEALVLRYRKALLRYCRRLPLPDGRVEDVLQQSLLQAWMALRRGVEVREPRAWLYRVVRNTALNAVRDGAGFEVVGYAGVDPGHEQLEPFSEPDLAGGLAMRETLAGMAALPPMQREVMVLTAVGGHSHEEVAVALGITDGAVRGLLYRARATLRTAVTAFTPPPVLLWLAGGSGQGGPPPDWLSGLGAGGGAAGLGGILLKGGVVVVTAGTLISTSAGVLPTHGRAGHGTGGTASAKVGRRPAAMVSTRTGAVGKSSRLPSGGKHASRRTSLHRISPRTWDAVRVGGGADLSTRRTRRYTSAQRPSKTVHGGGSDGPSPGPPAEAQSPVPAPPAATSASPSPPPSASQPTQQDPVSSPPPTAPPPGGSGESGANSGGTSESGAASGGRESSASTAGNGCLSAGLGILSVRVCVAN